MRRAASGRARRIRSRIIGLLEGGLEARVAIGKTGAWASESSIEQQAIARAMTAESPPMDRRMHSHLAAGLAGESRAPTCRDQWYRPTTMQALWPPKPNELLMAKLIRLSRGTSGV